MSLRAGNSSISSGPRALQVESLERRDLLSVAPAEPPQVYMDLDVLRIYGTSEADRVIVESYEQGAVEMVSVTISDAAGTAESTSVYQFEAEPIRKIVCRLLEGDDYFRNDAGIFSQVFGNADCDTLIGGSAYDRLFGGSHDDVIYGNGSRDVIQAGGGNDTIYGGAGNDLLKGQTGHDTIYGEVGNDTILGGSGNDTMDGGDGDDRVDGFTGDDTIYGGSGNDVLFGRNSVDIIYGGDGDDRLYAGGQDDQLYGEAGRDRLFGGNGNNLLDGGDGNDGIYGGHGNDQMVGGNGSDVLRGYNGNDTLLGEAGNDRLFGGEGDDTLYGGDGSDQLDGEAGNDGLFGGGTETDSLSGGEGSDRFLVHGTDTVNDQDNQDAVLQFVDGYGEYTAIPAQWTDEIIQKLDLTFALLQETAGSALILADSLSSSPVSLYLTESITYGATTSGLNYFDGYQREIYIRNDSSDDSLAAAVVHEFSHTWDSSYEGNQDWDSFQSLYEQSTNASDFVRSYGQNNAKEDWATNWEYYFGYYHWAAPENPSSLFLAKQAAVEQFFTSFSD